VIHGSEVAGVLAKGHRRRWVMQKKKKKNPKEIN
jgi:hypothetical protein